MAFLKNLLRLLGLQSRTPTAPLARPSASGTPVSPTPASRAPENRFSAAAPTDKPVKPVRLPSRIDDLVEMGLVTHSRNRLWSVGMGGVTADRRAVRLRQNETQEIRAIVNTLTKPHGAHVSDVGIFAVDDGRPNELHSDLIVFDASGTELYRRVYEANLFGFGISADGRYLACKTANASNSDGSIFEIHDVVEKRVLASRQPVTGYCDEFDFEVVDGKLQKVFVKLQGLGKFAYDPAGEFLDGKKYLTARLNKGNYAVRIAAAEELLRSDRSDKAVGRALKALDAAIEGAARDEKWLASAWRAKAEVLESRGDLDGAIKAYRMALETNPKVGVKKKVLALERRILEEASAPGDLFSEDSQPETGKASGAA